MGRRPYKPASRPGPGQGSVGGLRHRSSLAAYAITRAARRHRSRTVAGHAGPGIGDISREGALYEVTFGMVIGARIDGTPLRRGRPPVLLANGGAS